MPSVPRHREAVVHVAAPPGALFERLDDQTRLAEHMNKSSAMMGGGRMTYDFDAGQGRAVGSHIRMGGAAFGLEVFVDEVVTERDPPRRKVWRTTGAPKLWVIDGYEMGFEVAPEEAGSRLRVWIDYQPSAHGLGHWAPQLADLYAGWCVGRMADDARLAYAPQVIAAVRPHAA